MANLVIKNNTGTASSITFDNKSGSDWKIINNNGTFTLNGKSTNWFTLSDAGIAKFEGRVAIKMDPDESGDYGKTYAASALSVNGYILAYNGNIRAVRDTDDTVMVWIKNNKGSVSLSANSEGRYGLLDRLHGTDGTWMLYYDHINSRQQQSATYFTGALNIANSANWPSIQFLSEELNASTMGRISYGLADDPTANKPFTEYHINRFYFQQFSYKSNTKERVDKRTDSEGNDYYPSERFRLPKTAADLTTKEVYDILTTKNLVTIPQGGTGASTAAGARTNLGTAPGAEKKATVGAAGWYRIAQSNSGISNCNGIFEITGAVSGAHTTATITASTSYGKNSNIQALVVSHYSTASISKARIVYHTTYSGNYAYLEV